MNTINKQKFLAELGKLLTFMYEEDRQTALAMYVKMFEDTEDEQALLQALVSPTRQAVIVARAYNAKMRKLQVEAQSRADAGERVDDESTADFVLAINQVYQEAVPARASIAAPLKDQFSLFEDDLLPEPEVDMDYAEDAADAPAAFSPIAEPAEAAVTFMDGEAVSAPEEEEDFSLPAVEPVVTAPTVSDEAEDAEADGDPAVEPVVPAGGDDAVDAPVGPDELDAFLADFSIEDDPLISAEDEAATDPDAPESPMDKVFDVDPEEAPAVLEDAHEDLPAQTAPQRMVRKARPLLLILYILLAIPITVALVAILLIPAALFLGLAGGAIVAGAAFFVTAFSGFPVLADILIVLGAGLVILALGLLFLWIFIWFIGGAIVGLIRGVVSLGGRWCYKEVAA